MGLPIYNERTLMIVTEKGVLKVLSVPFQVRALHQVENIKVGMLVSVEAVRHHEHYRIMYRVVNKWLPYNDFIISHHFNA